MIIGAYGVPFVEQILLGQFFAKLAEDSVLILRRHRRQYCGLNTQECEHPWDTFRGCLYTLVVLFFGSVSPSRVVEQVLTFEL